MNYSTFSGLTPSEVVSRARKVVTLIDTPGSEKGLKTTLFGLTCYQPDYSILLVSADKGVEEMTREHLKICQVKCLHDCLIVENVLQPVKTHQIMSEFTRQALEISVIIVVTKMDLVTAECLQGIINDLEYCLKSVQTEVMCSDVSTNMREDHPAEEASQRPAKLAIIRETDDIEERCSILLDNCTEEIGNAEDPHLSSLQSSHQVSLEILMLVCQTASVVVLEQGLSLV